jgi:hypothetical protein
MKRMGHTEIDPEAMTEKSPDDGVDLCGADEEETDAD